MNSEGEEDEGGRTGVSPKAPSLQLTPHILLLRSLTSSTRTLLRSLLTYTRLGDRAFPVAGPRL